jgi:hypothetical protein
MKITEKKVVVVYEVDGPEYFRGQRIGETEFFAVEMDGIIIVTTLMPSNTHKGCYVELNDLLALKANKEVCEQITKPDLTAIELIALLHRYQERI